MRASRDQSGIRQCLHDSSALTGRVDFRVKGVERCVSHVLPGLQAEAAKRMDEAIGCQIGCQDEDSTSGEPQELRSSGTEIVSRLGIVHVCQREARSQLA